MGRNVVVCCDGTANEFARDWTNVVKLYSTLEADKSRQLVYYHPGVGTMAPSGALTAFSRFWTTYAGFAFGYGLKNDIRDAYTFIINSLGPEDTLFLFGFSRGAYTVRALTSLLRMFGVIGAHNAPLVPYAIEMLWSINRARHKGGTPAQVEERVKAYFDLATEFSQTFSTINCSPHFVGLWDTVSSVGWIGSPVSLPYTRSDSNIKIGRHAVAIDEHRAFFRTNLWMPDASPKDGGPIDLKQVWFPGVHADVGGGYPEKESGLSKVALKWMIDEARQAGLQFNEAKVQRMLGQSCGRFVPPDSDGMIHDSLTYKWWPAEFVPKLHWNQEKGKAERRMNLFRHRNMGSAPCVHESAWVRDNGRYANCLPSEATRSP